MPKITELNPITSISNDDLLLVVDDPNGAPSNKKMTFDNFANKIVNYFDNKGVFDVIVSAANTGNVSFSNATISTRHSGQNLSLTSNGGIVSIIPNDNTYKWNFIDSMLVLESTNNGNIVSFGQGMGPTIYSESSLFTYSFYTNNETNENWDHGSVIYPGTNQLWTEYSNNQVNSGRSSYLTLRSDLNNQDSVHNWQFNANGILNLPSTVGDIYRDGSSVLTSQPFLSPNISYTGVFNGYPATIPVTKGQAVFFTSNGYVLETTGKYWWDGEFDTYNYDLSGVETLDFYNIGGIKFDFRLGGKSETLLTDVNLHDIVVIQDDFYMRDLPALTTFSANNLSYVGGYFQIDNMDNANTQFNFPSLKTINGTFYYTYNDTLENTPQFPALETINNSLYIYWNSATQNTMTFDSLRYFNYSGIYQNQGMLAGPIFSELTSFNYMDFNNNDNMIDPPQFPALETFTGSFYFYGHDSVTTFPETPSMTTANYLTWYQNPVADGGFDFSSLTNVTSTINISENNSMTTAPAFPALVEVNGALLIENNSSLVNGFSFPSLKRVDSNVSMANCSLDETSVNYILMLLASLDGTNGTTSYDNHVVNLSGGSNAIPTGDGLTAIATLEGRFCTVYYNTP